MIKSLSPKLFIILLNIIIFPLAILSGLSASLTLNVLIAFYILHDYKFLTLYEIKKMLNKHKCILYFLLWALMSCTWSVNVKASIKVWLFLVISFLSSAITYSLRFNFNKYSDDRVEGRLITNDEILIKLNFDYLFYGLILSIITFYCEYLSDGFFTKFYAYITNNHDYHTFNLYSLDRGCALISTYSWILIASLIVKRKLIIAALLYLAVFSMLWFSDSLASYIAYTLSIIVFTVTYYMEKNFFFNIVKLILIIFLILFIYNVFFTNPSYVINKMQILPVSAKHRLYIWQYVSSLISQHYFIGFGLNSSRELAKHLPSIIKYGEYTFSLLPLHPHNIFLQVLLELGLIELSLMLLMLNNIFDIIVNLNDKILKAMGLTLMFQYLFIDMISYNIWQTWWISSLSFIFISAKKLKYLTEANKINIKIL